MSPIGKATILAATFALGFAAAWTIRPSTQIASTTAEISPSDLSGGTKSVRPPRDEQKQKVASLLKSLDETLFYPEKIDAILAGVTSAEFLGLVQEYSLRAGLTGLEGEDQMKIEKLLTDWQAKDPDAALQWVLGLPKLKDRQEFLSMIIGQIASKDLDAATALIREHGREEHGGWNIPERFVRELGKRDAETMVRVLGSFISSNGTCSLPHALFAEGFDYRAVADGLAAIQSKLDRTESGHIECLAAVPHDLMSEWTEHDASGAWQWLMEGNQLRFADLTRFFEAYSMTASPEEVAGLVVEAMELKSTTSEKFDLVWSILAEKPSATMITQFLAQVPGTREENLRNLFRESARGHGGNFDPFNQLLLQQMSPSERLAVVGSRFEIGASPNDFSFYTPLLRQLGHSDEEIRQMLPERK